MTSRDEVIKNMFPKIYASNIEAEYFFDDEENLPYEESHKDIIAYDGEFAHVNLSPEGLRELRAKFDSGEISVDPVALSLAEQFMEKRCSSGIEAGKEPYRGEKVKGTRVKKLSDCIGDFRIEHIIPCQMSDFEIEENQRNHDFKLIDFSMLNGDI